MYGGSKQGDEAARAEREMAFDDPPRGGSGSGRAGRGSGSAGGSRQASTSSQGDRIWSSQPGRNESFAYVEVPLPSRTQVPREEMVKRRAGLEIHRRPPIPQAPGPDAAYREATTASSSHAEDGPSSSAPLSSMPPPAQRIPSTPPRTQSSSSYSPTATLTPEDRRSLLTPFRATQVEDSPDPLQLAGRGPARDVVTPTRLAAPVQVHRRVEELPASVEVSAEGHDDGLEDGEIVEEKASEAVEEVEAIVVEEVINSIVETATSEGGLVGNTLAVDDSIAVIVEEPEVVGEPAAVVEGGVEEAEVAELALGADTTDDLATTLDTTEADNPSLDVPSPSLDLPLSPESSLAPPTQSVSTTLPTQTEASTAPPLASASSSPSSSVSDSTQAVVEKRTRRGKGKQVVRDKTPTESPSSAAATQEPSLDPMERSQDEVGPVDMVLDEDVVESSTHLGTDDSLALVAGSQEFDIGTRASTTVSASPVQRKRGRPLKIKDSRNKSALTASASSPSIHGEYNTPVTAGTRRVGRPRQPKSDPQDPFVVVTSSDPTVVFNLSPTIPSAGRVTRGGPQKDYTAFGRHRPKRALEDPKSGDDDNDDDNDDSESTSQPRSSINASPTKKRRGSDVGIDPPTPIASTSHAVPSPPSSPLSSVKSSQPTPAQAQTTRGRPRRAAAVAKPVIDANSSDTDVDEDQPRSEDIDMSSSTQGTSQQSAKGRRASQAKGKGKKEKNFTIEVVQRKTSVSNGKGKGKGVKKEASKVVEAPVLEKPKAASSMLPTPSSSFAPVTFAASQTNDERADKWSLNSMDQLVWVAIGDGDAKFWWPADIMSKLRSERPLKIHLLSTKALLKLVPLELLLEEPSHLNILAFRHSSRVRFTKETFSPVDPSAKAPSIARFETFLAKALVLEARRNDEDEDAVMEEVEEEEAEEEEVDDGAVSSDEELTREGLDETDGLAFPLKCLAKARTTWWPAHIISYQAHSNASKPGKFVVEWVDGTSGSIQRDEFLEPRQAAFYTVPLGEVELITGKQYETLLVEFVKDNTTTLDAILDDTYPPAKAWNASFFAGGPEREALAKRARFGDLTESHQGILGGALMEWVTEEIASGRPVNPILEDGRDLTSYAYQVLVPLFIILLNVKEHELDVKASAELLAASDVPPTQHRIDERAFQLSQMDLERGSLNKWVKTARAAKAIAEENPEGMDNVRQKNQDRQLDR